ncbi:RHOMBOID-like protein 5 [Syzygium oleosum]|uniref:RHOMBOID-like protein 5 n=1 Tax=Syzygium oleosum TaxID=219896 RepID=UPI0011D1E5D8|nr:RHOMBOID-like protein 5 [Syzygium oleosum]
MGKSSSSPSPSSSPLPASDIEKGTKMPRPAHHHFPPPPPPKQWFSWVIPLIFLANIGLFVYTMYVNDCPRKKPKGCTLYPLLGRFSFQPLKENPLLGPSVLTLEKLGGLERKLVVDDAQGWRMISCIWLHAGVLHLATNMLSLMVVGIGLEQEFGFLKIAALYVLSGFGGSLLSTLTIDEDSKISVGASGALFGLLGAMLSELITNWTIYANKCTALFTLVIVVAINLAVGLLIPHVDNSAHIGGFISGFLLGFVLLIRPQFGYVSRRYIPDGYDVKHKKSKHKSYQYCLWVTALILLVAGYASGLAKLFNGQVLKNVPF